MSQEQQNRFGLRGYVAAYILPEGFAAEASGVEYARQEEAKYAVMAVRDPFKAPFERVSNAYKRIMAYLQANGFRDKLREDVLPCFEHEYEKDGVTYMDIYIHVGAVSRTDSFTSFS